MSAQRFTGEQLRSFRGVTCVMHGHTFRQGACDSCANCGHLRRDHHVDAALTQAASLIEQVEQMREYVERMSDYWRSRGKDSEPFSAMVERFKALFPKDGGQ